MSGPSAAERNEGTHFAERTAADLSSLLTELARVLRGGASPGSDATARRRLLDRAFLAFHVELERCGPIDLRIEHGGFRSNGLSDEVPAKRSEDLVEALLEHGVERVRFMPGLSRDAFHAFVEFLDHPGDGRREGSGPRATRPCNGSGIAINDAAEPDTIAERLTSGGAAKARKHESLH